MQVWLDGVTGKNNYTSRAKAYCGLGEWHDKSSFHFWIVTDVYVVQYRE
jgi:hypothetical protein